MSRAHFYRYGLSQRRRQQLAEERVRKNTSRFHEIYSQQYMAMLAEGLDKYIPDEMEHLKNELERIERFLVNDPFAAREISFDVGEYIISMRDLASKAKTKQALELRKKGLEAEKDIIAAAAHSGGRAEALEEYFRIVGGITERDVITFAAENLDALRKAIENGSANTENISGQIAAIVETAREKAAEWHKAAEEKSKESVIECIESISEEIQSQNINNSDIQKKLAEKVQALKKLAERNPTSAEITNGIQEINSELDEAVISEETRREAVKAIYSQLKALEFTVDPPELITEGGENYVLLRGHRPSGKRAVFKIELNGTLSYKFDKYEGMSCLKDIEQVNVGLAQAYSLELSDERILWSNPDRLSADSVNNPDSKGAK